MKNGIYIMIACMTALLVTGCDTGKEVFLVTDRDDAYISDIQMYTADNRNVVVANSVVIDEENGVITALVKNGVNIARLKPRCTLAPEASVTPKMGVWTDFSGPVEYTVISGSRLVRTQYRIILSEQQ